MNKLTVEKSVFKWSVFVFLKYSWFFRAALWVFALAGHSHLMLGHSSLCLSTDVPAEHQIFDYIRELMTSFSTVFGVFFFFLHMKKYKAL